MNDHRISGRDYLRLVSEISRILHDHDPACIGDDSPDDEYDAEAAQILAQGRSVANADQLSVVIANVLRTAFDEWTGGRSLGDRELTLSIWATMHRR